MKCDSCELEINPQWKYAIDINLCPFCGKSIMDEELKIMLSTLHKLMTELQNYPQQLDDWMFANFSYAKSNYKKPTGEKSIVKMKTKDGEIEVETESLMSDEKTSEFFERAQVIKKSDKSHLSEKTAKLKEMVDKIKNGEVDSNLIMNIDDYNESEELSSFESSDGGEEIPMIVQNMAEISRGSTPNSNTNTKDMLALQKMHDGLKESKRKFKNGGGSFSRNS
jgi:wobble nucleotide-excising tRNase